MDAYGKMVEAIWTPGIQDNGFFDYMADISEKLDSSLRSMKRKNDKQKSIVVNENDEIWTCQYFSNPYKTDFSGNEFTFESILHTSVSSTSREWPFNIERHGVPDTDYYRFGTKYLWIALGIFFGLPTTYSQRQDIAKFIEENSNGVFVYEDRYSDIRSYVYGRSATIQEIVTLLSLEIKR